MRTAIIALVASVAVLGASPAPADANWLKKIRLKKIGRTADAKFPERVGWKFDAKVLQPAKTKTVCFREIDDEVLQPAKDVVEDPGRGIDDEVLQPAKEESGLARSSTTRSSSASRRRMRPLHPAEVIWILVGPTSVNEGADRLTEPSDDGKTGTTGTTPLLPSATATEPSADGTTGATLPSAQTPIPLARENETP